jgi:histidine transport system permease protein
MIELVQQYWRQYLWGVAGHPTGLVVTLWLTVVSLGLGFILAVPLAILRVSKIRGLSLPVSIYTYLFRGTPLYVQLLLIYTGVYSLDVVHSIPALNAFFRDAMNCTILAFMLNTAAYTTEIFAGAIRSTNFGEIEAGRACGMSNYILYRRIILPSALRRALPAYSNEVILMLHATTLAATATVPDILKVARSAATDYYLPFVAYGIAALLYLCISFALIYLFRRAEDRMLAHLARNHG